MPAAPTDRRLVMLRHAKSKWPSGVPDHERPLAGKGRRNAQASGQWFTAEGPRPDLVLCSDAVRAMHTWEIVRGCFEAAPYTRLEPRLYGAEVEDILALAQETARDVRTLLLVGHEPTMSATILTLAGPESDPALVGAVKHKFPTNAVAVLRFAGLWNRLGPAGATLETFVVPRAPVE